MLNVRRILGLVCGLLVIACLLACGNVRQAAVRQKTMNDMKQLGIMYHNYLDAKMKGPANAQELGQMAMGDPQAAALAAQTGPGGKYVLFWDVKIIGLPAGSSATVLGYEANVPASGGIVLMADGGVRQMTAGEFAAATKPLAAKK